ncbi:zinc ribbon domain-containing protein [Bifidobacterium cuniculi]|uniref:zinc ribbon domain-containing protein n=1 Tax=Bifidobacterium cuniculi TaxID=1688 RepID=UPI0012E071C6|nr:zinc ribbon domain-containing protein [Bifidobacterium cuniculi]
MAGTRTCRRRIDRVGWLKATYGNVCEELGEDVDRNLFTNVLDHEGHFTVPVVGHTRFCYDQSNDNSCRRGELDADTGVVTYRRMAVADRFVDITLRIAQFTARYPDAVRVSRPDMRKDSTGNIVFDVVVFVLRPLMQDVSKSAHAVGFDLNADWHGGISGTRLSCNGHVSRPLVVSRNTKRQQDKLERIYVQYRRCLDRLDRLMPWQRASDPDNPADVAAHPKWANLYVQSLALRDKMYRIKEILDWRYAHDMLDHAKPGELVAVERLDPFDNAGRYEFRHGSQLDKLDHVAAKRGQRVVKVNPAHTSDTCPWCNTRIGNLGRNREYECPRCHRTVPRDYGSAINIAKRGCAYLGHKHVRPTPKKGRPTPKRPKLIQKRHSGAAHEALSGTGKGPVSFHTERTAPTPSSGMATATVQGKRKRATPGRQLGQCYDAAAAGTATTSS